MRERYSFGILYNRVPIRDTVLWFAYRMELKLRKNDHKKHWSELENAYLHGRIYDELIESEEEAVPDRRIDELADSANFCMMEADNLRATSTGEDFPQRDPVDLFAREDVRRSMKKKGLDTDKIEEIMDDLQRRAIIR